MSNRPLFFNYDWTSFSDDVYPRIIREFLDNGVDHFVFTCTLLERALKEPDFVDFLKGLEREYNVTFGAMHALFGGNMCLNLPEVELRPAMLETHKRTLEIASDFQVKTLTIHVDAYHYVHKHIKVEETRPFFREALSQIVPVAEKLGVVLAIENCFEKPNSPNEITAFASEYEGNPNVGFCFDTGHANIMANLPWKDKAKYSERLDIPHYYPVGAEWWEGLELEDDAFGKMRDNIVTCHIHDNNGYCDLHGMPGDGTIQWDDQVRKLKECPRMIEYQTELCFKSGTNWAGRLLAPKGGYSIKCLADTFRKLGFN